MEFLSSPLIRVQSLKNLYQTYKVEVDVLRLDLIHPLVSGNKWFKLKEFVKLAKEKNKTALLTFGGAYSNHILATAAAARELKLQAIGIIRGERSQQLSTTLQDAEALGMQLYFVSREAYKSKEIPETLWFKYDKDNVQLIDEGGYGVLGRKGIESLEDHFAQKTYTHLVTAVGTGTTLAGLVSIATNTQQVVGVSVLKKAFSLAKEINALLPPSLQNRFNLLHDFHFGGYAKATPALFNFINQWYRDTEIPLDFVYTGKAFYAADQLIRSNFFPVNSRVLLVHSGGLQGNRSLPKDTLIF